MNTGGEHIHAQFIKQITIAGKRRSKVCQTPRSCECVYWCTGWPKKK